MNRSDVDPNLPPGLERRQGERRRNRRATFSDDFRRFFLRGLSALLPTIITFWLLVWIWSFLWDNLGQHMISAIIMAWKFLSDKGVMEGQPLVYMRSYWFAGGLPMWLVQLIGVGLSIVLIYLVGLLVGNLIGRTIWRLAEMAVMRIPLVRAVYPAVKQVTDFVLAERSNQFASSQVVAVRPHADGIWSIGLVTGPGLRSLSDAVGGEMVTVFIPSTPTAFSGYVMVVPREAVVELPLKVEEAMRLLVSGGVITPGTPPGPGPAAATPRPPLPAESANRAPAPELLPEPPRNRGPAAARLAND